MKGYTVVLSPDPNDGGYAVSCPAMPGALSQGDSCEEALRAAAEVMAAWMEVAAEDGYAPLEETAELVANEVAFVLGYRAEEGWDMLVETALVHPAVVAAS